jgi:hypothetical protein
MRNFHKLFLYRQQHKQDANCPREKRKTKSGKEQIVILPMFADEWNKVSKSMASLKVDGNEK